MTAMCAEKRRVRRERDTRGLSGMDRKVLTFVPLYPLSLKATHTGGLE